MLIRRVLLTTLLLNLVSAICLPGLAKAQIQTTIDFESVPGVTPTPSFIQLSAAPPNSYLSDQLLDTYGVTFYSDPPHPAAVAYIRLGLGHATSGSFGVGSIDRQSRIDYSLPLMASFFMPDSTSTPAVTDIVSIKGDNASCCETLTIEAYDVHGGFLASASAEAAISASYVELSHPGIHTVRVLEESGTVAWDDFAFGTLTPVPEPSTLSLAGIAGAAALYALRHRAKGRRRAGTRSA